MDAGMLPIPAISRRRALVQLTPRIFLLPRRHVLGEGETMTQHAVEASRRALEMAGVKPEEVDMVLMATSSPDDLFGSAAQVQVRHRGWPTCPTSLSHTSFSPTHF